MTTPTAEDSRALLERDYPTWPELRTHLHAALDREAALIAERDAALGSSEWQSMETAPKDGKHCILAVQNGPFVHALQGTYYQGKWINAADRDGEVLCWRPMTLIPDVFLPWTDEFKDRAALTQEKRA